MSAGPYLCHYCHNIYAIYTLYAISTNLQYQPSKYPLMLVCWDASILRLDCAYAKTASFQIAAHYFLFVPSNCIRMYLILSYEVTRSLEEEKRKCPFKIIDMSV